MEVKEMNIEYLDTLPERSNKFNVELQEGEKVVFTAKLKVFGTETDRVLGGSNSRFTLTNRRIIADNGVGIWTVDIKEDVTDCVKIQSGKFIFKMTYFSVNMNKEIIFNNEKEKMSGFHFYFKKSDMEKFEKIISNILK